MEFSQLEKMFNRSLQYSTGRKKWLLVFSGLLLCGLIAVICRALSAGAGDWVALSMAFLPMFLCSGILMAIGIILTRIYYHEVKGLQHHYTQILLGSRPLLLGISYVAIPFVLTYLLLWILLGVFYLMKAIPAVGSALAAVFSFGPFLLVLGSLALGLVNLLVLFFLTPAAALRSDLSQQVTTDLMKQLKVNPFLSFFLALMGLLPILLVVGFLSLAAALTGMMYAKADLVLILKWFFMMIPFAAVLTPAVVFFFNFAAESYSFLRRKVTA